MEVACAEWISGGSETGCWTSRCPARRPERTGRRSMSQRFAGRIAIVTGAGCVGPGWGNGRAIAVGLAREGATVIGVDRRLDSMAETAERIAAEGGRFETAQLDVTDGAAIARLVADIAGRHGRIDVLVNNVGGSA